MFEARTISSRLLLLLGAVIAATGCSDEAQRSDGRVDGLRRDGRRDTRRAVDYLEQPDLVSPGSDRCLGGPSTTVTVGKLELKGTTAGAINEYGTGIRCGETDPLIGPQRYYRLELQQGTTYRFELQPSFEAVLLLSSNCGANAMNTDCGSQGATGAFSGKIAAGSGGTIFFTAPIAGSYWLGVDSYSASSAGPFTLILEGFAAPSNSRCSKAQAASLTGGKLSLQGSTLGGQTEFPGEIHCGLGITLDGPQVYYTVNLNAGSWYRFGLSPQFAATVLIASSAASCKPQNIEADCSGKTGSVLPLVPVGGSTSAAFSPATSGSYLLAVKSASPTAAGSFTLQLESFAPPGNMVCAAATPLTLIGGLASASGGTQTYLNDLGALVHCGSSALPLLGPQAYYKVDLKAATAYQLLLKPSFSAVMAIGQSCQTLPADCGSGGLSGAYLPVAAGKTGSMLFKPATAGSYTLAVDSLAGPGGAFSLQVKEYLPPQNGVCTQPKLLVLSGGTALEAGDTSPLKNDLVGIACGLSGIGPWSGPQAYYRVAVKAGKSYQVELQPEASFDPALYAFPAATACTASAVNVACTNHASDKLGPGIAESLLLKPAADTEMIIVVDSWSTSEVGTFTLSIVEK